MTFTPNWTFQAPISNQNLGELLGYDTNAPYWAIPDFPITNYQTPRLNDTYSLPSEQSETYYDVSGDPLQQFRMWNPEINAYVDVGSAEYPGYYLDGDALAFSEIANDFSPTAYNPGAQAEATAHDKIASSADSLFHEQYTSAWRDLLAQRNNALGQQRFEGARRGYADNDFSFSQEVKNSINSRYKSLLSALGEYYTPLINDRNDFINNALIANQGFGDEFAANIQAIINSNPDKDAGSISLSPGGVYDATPYLSQFQQEFDRVDNWQAPAWDIPAYAGPDNTNAFADLVGNIPSPKQRQKGGATTVPGEWLESDLSSYFGSSGAVKSPTSSFKGKVSK